MLVSTDIGKDTLVFVLTDRVDLVLPVGTVARGHAGTRPFGQMKIRPHSPNAI